MMETTRRDFVKLLVPGCALGCMGLNCLNSFGINDKNEENQRNKADFSAEFKRTYEKAFQWKYNSYIEKMEELSLLIGRDKMLDLLETSNINRNIRRVKTEGGAFNIKQWALNLQQKTKTLTIDYPVCMEDRVDVVVTECLHAKTFLRKNAGDIGYATICSGDPSNFRTMHPKLKFERTKTLMQGHNICDGTLTLEE